MARRRGQSSDYYHAGVGATTSASVASAAAAAFGGDDGGVALRSTAALLSRLQLDGTSPGAPASKFRKHKRRKPRQRPSKRKDLASTDGGLDRTIRAAAQRSPDASRRHSPAIGTWACVFAACERLAPDHLCACLRVQLEARQPRNARRSSKRCRLSSHPM